LGTVILDLSERQGFQFDDELAYASGAVPRCRDFGPPDGRRPQTRPWETVEMSVRVALTAKCGAIPGIAERIAETLRAVRRRRSSRPIKASSLHDDGPDSRPAPWSAYTSTSGSERTVLDFGVDQPICLTGSRVATVAVAGITWV
jgi:hypothetical protein